MSQKEINFNSKNVMQIDGCDTIELAKKYKTPLYVINETEIEQKCKMYKDILAEIYPNSIVSYASKAFCCKYIYSTIKKYDMFCDVVSMGEMATALATKFDPEKIIFHGNNKTPDEINFALKNKVYTFVIDNETEFNFLSDTIKNNPQLKKKINILVRINPGIEAHTHEFIQTAKIDSKFGVNVPQGDAEKFIVKINENKDINFLGLHTHIGSQIFEKEPFVTATKIVMEFVYMLKQKHNIDIKTVDIGGGFPAWYNSKDPILEENDYKKILKGLVVEIKNAVKKYNLIEPTLIIEPGRSLVCEAGTTLYTVGNIKDIKGIRKYVAIDGGMFENPRYALYQAEYTAVKCRKESDKFEKVTIVGKCCESGDIIAKDTKLEKVNTGDIIAILSTGAYNYSMASNYNRNTVPPVVCVKKGKSKVIIKGQTCADLLKYDL